MVISSIHYPFVKARGATRRALHAYHLQKKFGLTGKQACKAAGSSAGYLTTMNRLSPGEREQVAQGKLSLARLHNGGGNGNGNGNSRHRFSDAQLDRLITAIGIGRVWSSLERLTAPTT
jgi:hypothetical protein